MTLLAAVLLSATPLAEPRVSPADELRCALADLTTHVAPDERCQTRYVSLAALPATERAAARDVLSFVLNSVSRSATIIIPDVVPDSADRLLRISLSRLRLAGRALGSARGRRAVLAPPHRGERSRHRKADRGFHRWSWVGLEAAAQLRAVSLSSGAIVRGDWLVVRLAAPPQYYRFADVPEDEADFFRAVGTRPRRHSSSACRSGSEHDPLERHAAGPPSRAAANAARWRMANLRRGGQLGRARPDPQLVRLRL
ncbi:MAG: hypothetical protein R3C10_03735 [Pirellulales bacterium]